MYSNCVGQSFILKAKMDNLLYFLRFKALDRIGLTKRIFLFIISTLLLLFLVNYLMQPSEIWAPEIVLVTIFGAGLLLLLIAWPSLYECLCSFVTPPCLKFEDLNLEGCLNDIEFQGKVTFDSKEEALSVTNSGSGMLFHRAFLNYYWKDFEAIFEFKFVGERKDELLKASYEVTKLGNKYCTLNNYLGFIFRAKDLDNYFMLSIGAKKYQERKGISKCDEDNLEGKETLLITPHIRIGGMWEVFDTKRWGLPIPQFRIKDYSAVKIVVRGTRLDLWLGKLLEKQRQECQEIKEEIHLFAWNIPTHYSINWRDGQNKEEGYDDKGYTPGDSSKIPFRNSIGRIGFRAYGDEKFLVRNLTIKRIC